MGRTPGLAWGSRGVGMTGFLNRNLHRSPSRYAHNISPSEGRFDRSLIRPYPSLSPSTRPGPRWLFSARGRRDGVRLYTGSRLTSGDG